MRKLLFTMLAIALTPLACKAQSYESVLATAQNYWDCQEASGSLVDAPGTADLAPSGSPGYRSTGPTAWLPYAVDLSSGNTFSAASPAGRVAKPCTFAAWVKLDTGPPVSNVTILSRRNGGDYEYQFVWLGTRNPSLLTSNGLTTASTTAVDDTNWHYLAVVVGASSVYFYKDGTLETISATRTITNVTVGLRLGAYGTNDAPLPALVSGVGIWADDLTDSELDLLYAGPIDATVIRRPIFNGGFNQQNGGFQ